MNVRSRAVVWSLLTVGTLAIAGPSYAQVPVPASVTLGVNVAEITVGNAPTLTGAVVDATGAAVPGVAVRIDSTEWGNNAPTVVADVTTDANGQFSQVVRPEKQTKYFAHVGEVSSPGVLVRVHHRVDIDKVEQRVEGLVIEGRLRPPQAGRTVGIGRYKFNQYSYVGQTTSTSQGYRAVLPKVRKGEAFKYVVYVSGSHGLLYGSKSIGVYNPN